jgi:predicted 3-demethylubiquinone-9 3-methyltransferase (glyoxalase superfamily)
MRAIAFVQSMDPFAMEPHAMNHRFQRITPFLWFDEEAEAAAHYYVSIFDHSRILATTRYDAQTANAARRPPGTVMTVAFELDGAGFTALNGGPVFPFTPAMSLVVNCRTQEDVDRYWNALAQGGDPAAQQCGWLKDRFGLSWQVVPAQLAEWLACADPAKVQRVMQAILAMKKLDVAVLAEAAA